MKAINSYACIIVRFNNKCHEYQYAMSYFVSNIFLRDVFLFLFTAIHLVTIKRTLSLHELCTDFVTFAQIISPDYMFAHISIQHSGVCNHRLISMTMFDFPFMNGIFDLRYDTKFPCHVSGGWITRWSVTMRASDIGSKNIKEPSVCNLCYQ